MTKMIRIDECLHQKLKIRSAEMGKSLQDIVNAILKKGLEL